MMNAEFAPTQPGLLRGGGGCFTSSATSPNLFLSCVGSGRSNSSMATSGISIFGTKNWWRRAAKWNSFASCGTCACRCTPLRSCAPRSGSCGSSLGEPLGPGSREPTSMSGVRCRLSQWPTLRAQPARSVLSAAPACCAGRRHYARHAPPRATSRRGGSDASTSGDHHRQAGMSDEPVGGGADWVAGADDAAGADDDSDPNEYGAGAMDCSANASGESGSDPESEAPFEEGVAQAASARAPGGNHEPAADSDEDFADPAPGRRKRSRVARSPARSGAIVGARAGDHYPTRRALHSSGVHRDLKRCVAGNGTLGAMSVLLSDKAGIVDDRGELRRILPPWRQCPQRYLGPPLSAADGLSLYPRRHLGPPLTPPPEAHTLPSSRHLSSAPASARPR